MLTAEKWPSSRWQLAAEYSGTASTCLSIIFRQHSQSIESALLSSIQKRAPSMSTGDDDKGPSNPFIRWKQHVDSSIGFTLNGLLGIPTKVSQSFAMRRPDGESHQRDGNCTRGRDSASSETPGDATSSGLRSQLLEFKNFLYTSEYSPVHLHHLPPPVPRDIPMGVDPNGFTFSDAFEDLLVASSGSPRGGRRAGGGGGGGRRRGRGGGGPD